MIHLTMQQLEELGFEVVKSYPQDNYLTQRRKRGLITIETTWQMPSGDFESQDMTIEEVNCIPFNEEELKVLIEILDK